MNGFDPQHAQLTAASSVAEVSITLLDKAHACPTVPEPG